MAAPLDTIIASALEQRRRRGQLRTLETRDGPQQPGVRIDGREYANFCSNDYLGLAADPRVLERVSAELPRHGFGSGSAALLSGRSSLHAELESRLAAFTGMDSAVLFSSGYLANLGALQALLTRTACVFHDRLNHASLIDAVLASGARHRRYPHLDLDRLGSRLHDAGGEARWVVTESVFSMDGDSAPLDALVTLAQRHEAGLYVDDAHGFGVTADGRGACASLDEAARRGTIVMVTFGKALGSSGAAILASRDVCEYLVQFARTFVYDTAFPPVCAAAALEALAIIDSDASPLSRLGQNIARFRRAADIAGVPLMTGESPIQPVPIGSDERAVRVARAVCDAGFYVRAIRPPTVPAGTARIRITLSAAHGATQIEGLASALGEALRA